MSRRRSSGSRPSVGAWSTPGKRGRSARTPREVGSGWHRSRSEDRYPSSSRALQIRTCPRDKLARSWKSRNDTADIAGAAGLRGTVSPRNGDQPVARVPRNSMARRGGACHLSRRRNGSNANRAKALGGQQARTHLLRERAQHRLLLRADRLPGLRALRHGPRRPLHQAPTSLTPKPAHPGTQPGRASRQVEVRGARR
jgi:hypothetical protein